MAKIYEITIPVYRIQREAQSWGDTEFYVQQRQANGRWKRVSENYYGLHSAKAKLGSLVLEAIAEAEEQ
jgi:hypothetical protein